MFCLDDDDEPEPDGTWQLWLDFWAQAARNAEAAVVRRKSDEMWRATIADLVQAGQDAGEFTKVDKEQFAIGLSALLDGLTIQIALDDPAIDSVGAFELSMHFVANQLGFDWTPGRGRDTVAGRRGPGASSPQG